MARISVPTTARLPSTLRLDPSNTTVLKILNRLTRPSLLTLVLDWLDENNAPICAPYIHDPDSEDGDPTDLHPPAPSLDELRDIYADMQARKGSKREVLDRILDGDWRHGLTLYQLSMADLQYLYDHPTSQKWSAYRVVPLKTPSPQQAAEDDKPLEVDATSCVVPRFHPSTFLQSLQAQVLPDVKAHYNFDRPKNMPLLLLRIFILDSPYNTNLATSAPGAGGGKTAAAGFDASRTIYIAFPDGSPHVYISKSQTIGAATASETKSLRALVVDGIPKALSRPRERYTLKPTSLTTRNIQELLHRRGSGRTNAAGGGWGIYADDKAKGSPLDTVLPTPPLSEADEVGPANKSGEEKSSRKRAVSPETEQDERRAKRAKLAAQARFGDSARIDDGKGVERVDIVIDDSFPTKTDFRDDDADDSEEGENDSVRERPRAGLGRRSTIDAAFDRTREQDDAGGGDSGEEDEGGSWRPSVKLTFHGTHVFAGIRQLVEAGIIDGENVPGWLTGEEGVTIGAVRHGRIRGHRGMGV